jgi:membrane-bound lytic murein transglycosylase D
MKNLLCITLLILCLFASAQSQSNFPTDARIDQLKSFWVTIFTKYSDEYTLIHDSSNTDIVYSIIEHKGLEHFKRKRKVSQAIQSVQFELLKIRKKNFKKLSVQEENLLATLPESMKTKKGLNLLAKNIRAQQGMSNRFKDGLIRSNRFLKHIKEILAKYELPEELAYLPHVESSFNYFATSKVGAAGIWQIMPRTALSYKLKINNSTDERLDPLKASEVAIKLLRDNYRLVKSWPLAITAYNHGTKNIRKTILQLKSYDPILVLDSINRRSFQFASRNFYPSYLAAVEVAKNKKNYFPDIKDEENNELDELILAKRMSIRTISKKLDLTVEEIRQYNPQIVGVAWKKDFSLPKGFVIKYPKPNRADENNILVSRAKTSQLSFNEVKQSFDELCGIISSSIASNLR